MFELLRKMMRDKCATTTQKNAFCTFCRKSYVDVGPLVEGPGEVFICGDCAKLCQSILEQEQRRRAELGADAANHDWPRPPDRSHVATVPRVQH